MFMSLFNGHFAPILYLCTVKSLMQSIIMNNQAHIFIASGIALLIGFCVLITFIFVNLRNRKRSGDSAPTRSKA